MGENLELMTLDDAAKRLGISRVTLWRRIRELQLPLYSSPINKRRRLINWTDLRQASSPTEVLVSAATRGNPDYAVYHSHAEELERQTGLRIRIVPEQRLVVRASMLSARVIDTFETSARVGAAIIQAESLYATPEIGPFPIRDWYPSAWPGLASGYLTRHIGGLSSIWSIGKGTRIADYSAVAPGMKDLYLALLSWVGVSPNDVHFVPVRDVNAGVTAVVEGDADIAFAMPTSLVVYKAERSPAGVAWLSMHPNASAKDEQGAARHRKLQPTVTFRMNEVGSPSARGFWGLASYAVRLIHGDADPDFVYNLAKWRAEMSRPSEQGGLPQPTTLEHVRVALRETFIPIHDGAIRYFREQGIWQAADDDRQLYNELVARRYMRAWALAVAVAKAEGIPIDPGNANWMELWTRCKKDVPAIRVMSDSEVALALGGADLQAVSEHPSATRQSGAIHKRTYREEEQGTR